MVPPRRSRDAAGTAELPALLKKFRVQAGLSQQVLAERALISAQAVSALERGFRRAPYRATLERIADALALSDEARELLERSAHRSRGPRLVERDRAPLHNLPRQLTSFLGRDAVVAEIGDFVASAPLVSIVGTGGAGKTRAAVEVGRRLLNAISARRLVRRAGAAQRSGPGSASSCRRVARAGIATAFSSRDADCFSSVQTSANYSRQLRARYLAGARGRGVVAAALARTSRCWPRVEKP